jgi:hypothetical protein
MPATVLIVDDDPQTVDLFSRILTLSGYGVITAADGPEGLRQASQHHPDLLIVDLQMPVMTGAVMLEQLRQIPHLREVLPCSLPAILRSMRRSWNGIGRSGRTSHSSRSRSTTWSASSPRSCRVNLQGNRFRDFSAVGAPESETHPRATAVARFVRWANNPSKDQPYDGEHFQNPGPI